MTTIHRADTTGFVAPRNVAPQPPVHEGTLVRLKQRGRFGVRVAKSASPKRGDLARVTTWKGETKTVRLVDVERDGVDSITFTLPRRW